MAESTRVVFEDLTFDLVEDKIGDSQVYKGKFQSPGFQLIDVAVKRIPIETVKKISNPQSNQKKSPAQWEVTSLTERPINIVRWYTNKEDRNA
jgi:hypothetical protein